MHPDGITDFLSKFSKRHGLQYIHPHTLKAFGAISASALLMVRRKYMHDILMSFASATIPAKFLIR